MDCVKINHKVESIEKKKKFTLLKLLKREHLLHQSRQLPESGSEV